MHDIGALADELVLGDSVDVLQELESSSTKHPKNRYIGNIWYDQLPKTIKSLSQLRAIYERKNATKAISMLHNRTSLEIDESYLVDTDDPAYCFSCSKSLLDFILVVGSDVGIDMFIPNIATNHQYAISLNLQLQIKPFKAKYGTLGFNPSGAMWCLGQTLSEDLWLAMAPNEYFENNGTDFRMSEKHGDTHLSRVHFRIMQIFMISMLAKIEGKHYYIMAPYDIDIFNPETQMEVESNLL
jgi:hypothetical protein